MQKDRERKGSLSNDVLRPIIAIERNVSEDGAVRRSVSYSELEAPDPTVDSPLTPHHPHTAGMCFRRRDICYVFIICFSKAFALRTPSPGPPLYVDLSTIMEADNSWASKNPPSTPILSRLSSPQSQRKPSPHTKTVSATSNHQEATEEDTSALDLSTGHVADQVRNAILSSNSSPNSVKLWRNVDKAVVIIDADDKDDYADTAFDLDDTDPQLVALLSPNSFNNQNPAEGANLLQSPASAPPFVGSPATRLPRARQASSFLPRLRPSTAPPSSTAASPKLSPAKGKMPIIAIHGSDNSPPPSPEFPSLPAPTPSRRNISLSRPGKLFTPDRSNSLSYSHEMPLSGDRDPTNPGRSSKGRTLRRVVLGMTGHQANDVPSVTPTPSPSRIATFGRASLDSRRPATSASEIGLGRPSLEIRRGDSFDSRRRPSPTTLEPRSSTTSERTESVATAATTPNTEYSTPSPEIPHEEPIFQRPSLDSTARPSLDSVTLSRPGSSAARILERDRRTPSSRMFDSSGDRLGVPIAPRSRKRSMSVQERVGKAGRFTSGPANIDTNVARPGSSLSVGRPSRGGGGGVGESGEKLGGPGPKLEWLGPRTIKAFRAAGLLDPDREKGLKERDASGGDPLERLRDRSGSVSGMSATPPPGNNSGSGGPLSAPNRFASLRCPTEFNQGTRAHSRMAFSEVGAATSRRGSESISAYSGGNGFLQESPTFTGSSGSRCERDTPRSASTAPTSLSDAFGYFERDRDRDRDKEEIRELKDRHATEVAALLGALSDSQRTVRMLRDENSELRGRLERFAGVLDANDELRQTCADLQRECHELRRECAGLHRESTPISFRSSSILRAPGIASSWSGGSTNSSLRTAVPKLATSSPLAMDVTPFYEEEYNNTIIIHDSIDDCPASRQRPPLKDDPDDHDTSPLDDLLPSSTSTPSRRHSNTSSIFPAPPANMTMLLDDEGLSLSNRSSTEPSQLHFQSRSPTTAPSNPLLTPKATSHSRSSSVSSPPVTFKNLPGAGYYPNKSANISPTTADFSMVTGSPGSLFLRPEHEQLLGDMESLDLGAIPPIDLGLGKGRDDW